MRAREFITEGNMGTLLPDVAAALPATYVIPALANQDPYRQYRFGLAIARAKSRLDREHQPGSQNFDLSSAWGENQIIVSYSNSIDEYINDALREMGLGPDDKRLISTPRSEETSSVNKQSPVPQRRTNQWGV